MESEQMITVILWPLILAMFIFFATIYKRRAVAIRKIASKRGLKVVPKTDPNIDIDLDLFKQGRVKKLTNLIETKIGGVRWLVFDYYFDSGLTTTNHADTTGMNQTVFVACNLNLNIPHFSLRAKNLSSKLSGVSGVFSSMRAVDFTKNSSFSEKYLVKGDNEPIVKSFFSDKIIRSFERIDITSLKSYGGKDIRRINVNIEGNNNYMMFYYSGMLEYPKNIFLRLEQYSEWLKIFTR